MEGQGTRPLERDPRAAKSSTRTFNRIFSIAPNFSASFCRHSDIARDRSAKLDRVKSIYAADRLMLHCIPRLRHYRGADRGRIGDDNDTVPASAPHAPGGTTLRIPATAATAAVIGSGSTISRGGRGTKVAATATAATAARAVTTVELRTRSAIPAGVTGKVFSAATAAARSHCAITRASAGVAGTTSGSAIAVAAIAAEGGVIGTYTIAAAAVSAAAAGPIGGDVVWTTAGPAIAVWSSRATTTTAGIRVTAGDAASAAGIHTVDPGARRTAATA
jgi:hypothetical protein